MPSFLYEKLRAVFAAARGKPAPPTDTMPGRQANRGFDGRLLAVLACPSSHERLRYDAEAGELIADRAGLAYRIVDGIPILLAPEARRLSGNAPEA